MKSKTISKIWEKQGKLGAKNIIYGFSGNPLTKYDANVEPDMCIFAYVTKNGVEKGWLFDNIEIDGVRLRKRLASYIEDQNSLFIKNDKSRPYSIRTQANTELWDVLYAMWRNTTVEDAAASNVRMMDKYERITFHGEPVYDMTFENLVSDKMRMHRFMNGKGDNQHMAFFFERDDVLHMSIRNIEAEKRRGNSSEIFDPIYMDYVTQFSYGIYNILTRITAEGSWFVHKGSLMFYFSRNKEKVSISFAEIVGTYWANMVDQTNPKESIIGNRKRFSKEGIVFDHLTHNKENNFAWAISPVPDKLNSQLRGRDDIKPPYYFWTVYDTLTQKHRVKCGMYGRWDRRYLFDRSEYISDNAEDSLYITILKKFKEKIGKTNMEKGASYLSYWSMPEQMHNPENPLAAMSKEPEAGYRPAREAWAADGCSFDDMP